MPPIPRTCTLTGKKFLVSELEQSLREKFGVPLPDVHPNERMRTIEQFINYHVLYNHNCDLCGKWTMSMWPEEKSYPVFCHDCWYTDHWTHKELVLDLDRPFFDQLKDLYAITPRPARCLSNPMENSEYTNGAGKLKNCYLSFDIDSSQDCSYCFGSIQLRDCMDTVITMNAELIYQGLCCMNSYEVFWSEFAINCRNGYFLYDCVDANDCALSTGLRHKQYVFLNKQLTKEEYDQKIKRLQTGSYATLQEHVKQFTELKAQYPKKYIIGNSNESVSGNMIYHSHNVENCFGVTNVDNCVNVLTAGTAVKDCLDVGGFGIQMEQIYSSATIGINTSNIKHSWACFEKCSDLDYCTFLTGSNHCFGSAYAKKLEFSILNTRLGEEAYTKTVAALKQKMQERGEYGQMFRKDLIPFAYNESKAMLALPLTREEALARGFRWADRKVPAVPPEKVFTPPDNVHDVSWEDLQGKFILCAASKRPFKIIKPEFDFYKKYSIPLPRLHPEIRLEKLYPNNLILNMYETSCDVCSVTLQTSMPNGDRVLCDACYQKAVV